VLFRSSPSSATTGPSSRPAAASSPTPPALACSPGWRPRHEAQLVRDRRLAAAAGRLHRRARGPLPPQRPRAAGRRARRARWAAGGASGLAEDVMTEQERRALYLTLYRERFGRVPDVERDQRDEGSVA